MFTKILDFNIFNRDKNALMNYIENFEKVNIISGNPEVLFNGLNNLELKKNFKSESSIIIPDGVGTVIASKILRKPVKEKIAGIDIFREILIKANLEERSIYLLGSKEETIKKCVENIKNEFPKLKISGFHNGFLI